MQEKPGHTHYRTGFVMLFLLCTALLQAQEKTGSDTVFFLAHKKGLLGRIGKSLSVNNTDPLLPQEGATRNETPFNPYRGKIIRDIHFQKIGFKSSVNDTTRIVRNFFNEVGDALHPSTREQVIRNNLFFSHGNTLYPYLMADNERLLRSLSYLQDAKIMVQTHADLTDSVDIVVIYKDVFPLGGSMDAGSDKMLSFELNDDNLVGSGNRIQVRNLFDIDRRPNFGAGFEFLKRNVAGTFINLTGGFRNEAPAFNSGRREEKSVYLQGELPLVSPYHVWTGAFELSHHYTENRYVPDSIYRSDFKYDYRTLDGWLGYNIGARKQLQQNFKSRFKKLVSLRGIYRGFFDRPDLFRITYNFGYANLLSLLGAFTLFEQTYYHSNFIYGFGRNEDIPEGFNITFTGGWTNRNGFSRPYGGFEYQRNYFTDNKHYLNYTLRAGGYLNKGHIEDISFLTSIEFFTRLRKLGSGKWYHRHFVSGSLTQLVNTFMNDPLRLSSDYGIPLFYNPRLNASTRLTFNYESVFYNTWKLAGFSFAPFSFTNLTFLKPIGVYIESGDLYAAFGGGVRTRNENLVFGTMELKAYYYPRIVSGMNHFNITFNTDLRFRYISQLIRRPDFPVVN